MSEKTKNTLKDLAKMFAALAVFVCVALFVPDGSIVKTIFAYICVGVLILGAILYTPLGNPIKALYRRIKGIK